MLPSAFCADLEYDFESENGLILPIAVVHVFIFLNLCDDGCECGRLLCVYVCDFVGVVSDEIGVDVTPPPSMVEKLVPCCFFANPRISGASRPSPTGDEWSADFPSVRVPHRGGVEYDEVECVFD